MRYHRTFRWFLLLSLLAALLNPVANLASFLPQPQIVQAAEVTAYDLIVAMNGLRASYGNRLLVEDPIVMAVAQATAEIMAANQMSTHIGDVDGRLAAAGYGGGGKVWATENFAAGGDYSIDEIMLVWADEAHMLPATNAAYCHVGAGIAEAANVNLLTQTLMAFEYEKPVLEAKISSGMPNGPRDANGLSTKTPEGEFRIQDKMPAKHMGNGNLFANADDYELPGVPWTCFFPDKGHAFHGTYWHDNFGVPMSHGCINMRTEEAKWLFRWSWPIHKIGKSYNRGFGTLVQIHY